jgi:hypothetical protein
VVAALSVLALAPLRSYPQQPASARPERISFRIIVVESAGAAERVRERLAAGENFVVLAGQTSVHPTAGSGGLVGPVALSDLHPQLRSALQALPDGEVSGVVPLPIGFAILKLAPAAEATPVSAIAPGASAAMVSSFASPLGAASSVKYVLDVSGYPEMVVSLRRAAIPADAHQHLPTLCQMRRQLSASARNLVQQALSAGSGSQPLAAIDRAQTYFLQGQLHAYHGEMAPAIAAFEQARRLAVSEVPELRLQLEEALGIAHLHKAELENGILHAPGERCLLHPSRMPPMTRTADVTTAIDYFSRYLAEKPDDLEVRWLLNVAHMFAGSYPRGVPAAQLISPEALASRADVGRFVDVAPEAGLVSIASSGGLIVDDFDNDGRLDVVTSSIDSCESMHFFRRNADGTFADQTAKAGLAEQLGGLNILQADYNNDGHLDVLVLRGAWEMPQRKSLLRNNGDGTFTDVTTASGLANVLTGTQAAVWTDVDNDGRLDLFAGNENGPAQLFRNRGDGTFIDVAPAAGVDRRGFNKGVAAADYDNDGWPDLYVSNLGGTNFLYRNNHDGTFTEVGAGAGVPGPGQGFPTWFFDYDNDGYQDLFVGSFVTSVDEVARAYLRLPPNGNTLKLYRNLGDGSFQDVTRRTGLDKVLMAMGANFGDIDNDGYLDIYLGTGNPSYGALVPSVLLRNNAGQSFVDVTTSSGTGELHKGHGVAFADLDHDGDQEIVFQVGGATPGDVHALRLFENPGHRADWLALRLVGVKSNRAAIGARIAVTVTGAAGSRTIHRIVGSGGSFGASPLQQHIGLGGGAGRVDVEIAWPASGTRQRFPDVRRNQLVEITEFARAVTPLPRSPLPLRGAAR